MNELLDTVGKLHARAFLYELAHTVFGGEPAEALLAALRSPECRSTLRAMADGGDGLGPVGRLADYCERLDTDDAARAAELARCASDFNRVVAGLGAERTSHPWESAYMNSKQLLFQVETLEVRNAYRAFGYLPAQYPRVADDHVALECAFLAALARKTLEADGSGDVDERARLVAGQRDFLQDHLLTWAGKYAHDVHADAPDDLYDLTAAALAAFAEADRDFLTAFGEEGAR